MKWYEGNIASAIQESKKRKSLFVVFISGDDADSKKMSTTWEDASVSQMCEDNLCIGVSVDAKSEACTQFSKFYPVVCVPCSFFIGENGVPLEVIGGSVDAAELQKKAQAAIQMNQTQVASQTTQSNVQSPSGESSLSHEEKVKKVEELRNQKKLEKSEKEKEQAKKQENERRELGKQMTQFKQMKAEREQKEIKDQMKKDKEEEKKARERVKEQIARDRADRAARYKQEKSEHEKSLQEKKSAQIAAQQEAAAKAAAAASENAMIQFRLPDGSNITNTFSSSETLGSAREFLREKVGNTYGQFSLSTTYPRRCFTEEDMSQSMISLQLAPSSVVMVLPGSRSIKQPSKGDGGGFLMMLFAPFIALWGFLYNLLFSAPEQPRGAYNRQAQQDQQTAEEETQPSTSQRQSRPKSSYARRGPGLVGRQEGNIRRFTSDDGDDDMNTWNGNSTQQM